MGYSIVCVGWERDGRRLTAREADGLSLSAMARENGLPLRGPWTLSSAKGYLSLASSLLAPCGAFPLVELRAV